MRVEKYKYTGTAFAVCFNYWHYLWCYTDNCVPNFKQLTETACELIKNIVQIEMLYKFTAMNVIHFPLVGINYGIRMLLQYRYVQSTIKPLVLDCCEKASFTLTRQHARELFRTYPLYTVCCNAENFLILKGRKININERKRITLGGIMASLSDELLDEDGWSLEDLILLLNNQKTFDDLSERAKLLVLINEAFKSTGYINEGYLDQLQKAFIVQANSAIQFKSDISFTDAAKITKDKGGQANLLIGYLLDGKFSDLENKFIYQTGVLGQLMDDIYDIYEDLQQNIHTAITKARSINEMEAFFTEECRIMNELVRQMPMHKKLQNKLIRYTTFIPACAFIALEQFKQVEQQYGGPPASWKTLPRKLLIVDMEKLSNDIKMVKYCSYCAQL